MQRATDGVERSSSRLALGGNTTLASLFGPYVTEMTVFHLLHMTSGIRDYDRAAYTDDQFANRSRDFDPLTIVLEYSRRPLEFEPGTAQRYCSTNYVLLGLVLATHLGGLEAAATSLGAPSWQSYDQMSVLPPSLVLRASRFVDAGTCESVTPVHGFTEMSAFASGRSVFSVRSAFSSG